MGSLFVEIGQCGCQIGGQLNGKLANSYYCTRNRQPNRLHVLMIDTEPKVLKPLLDRAPRWLDPLNVKCFQYGRGNNWSYGYLHQLPPARLHGEVVPKHKQFSHLGADEQLMNRYLQENREVCHYTLERLRKELQTVDCALCINVLSSLGGGTGSGLGTRLVEEMRDAFQLSIYAHLVLPNKSGETPLQVYNCTLSLASLQEHCTAVFTYENDHLTEQVNNLPSTEEGSAVTLDNINAMLAANLARLFKTNDLPTDRLYTQLVSECLVSSEANYLSLFGSESITKNWQESFDVLAAHLKVYNHDQYADIFGKHEGSNFKHKLLHGELLSIGKADCEFDVKQGKKFRSLLNPLFEDSLNCQQIAAKGTHLSSLCEDPSNPKKKDGKEVQKTETMLVANHSNILRYLHYLDDCGRAKFEAKAYLWHYQYADLEHAFDRIETVIDQYESFVR